MNFEWDEAKRGENIRKHSLDFADAWKVFEGPIYIQPDTRFDYGEHRFIATGFLEFRIVLIAFSEPDEITTRIISMRKARKNERERLKNKIRN